jgi:hypothetical protein
MDYDDCLKPTIHSNDATLKSINRRIEEIKNDLTDQLTEQKRREITVNNLLKLTDNIKQLKNVKASSNKEPEEEIIKSINSAKYHYQNICKILKGSKLIILNKFYKSFYQNKKLIGSLNEQEEMSILSVKYGINLKLIKLFVSCKHFQKD